MPPFALLPLFLAAGLLDPAAQDPASLKLPAAAVALGALALVVGLGAPGAGPGGASHPACGPAEEGAGPALRPAAWLPASIQAWVVGSWLLAAAAPFPAHQLEALAVVMVGAAGFELARRQLTPAQLVSGLALVGGLVAAATLGELAWGVDWKAPGPIGYPAGELVGPLANPNLTATFLVLCLPALAARGRGLGLALALPALVGTLSRAAVLGVGAVAVMLGLGRGASTGGGPAEATPANDSPAEGSPAEDPSTAPRRLGLALGLGAAVALLVVGATSRFDLAQVLRTRTLRARAEMGRLFLSAAARRPLLGWGPGAAGVAYGRQVERVGRSGLLGERVEHAHNPFVQALVEGGALGLGLAVALWVLAAWLCWARRGAPDRDLRALAAGAAGWGVAELVGVGSARVVGVLAAGMALGGLAGRPDPAGEGPSPGGRSAWMVALGLLLLASTPQLATQARAGRDRKQLRVPPKSRPQLEAQVDRARPHGGDLEVRFDAAAALTRAGDPPRGVARWLWIESQYPAYPGAQANRQLVRIHVQGARPPAGPAPPSAAGP